MKKNSIFRLMAIAAVATLTLASCNKSKTQDDDKTTAQGAVPQSMKIAYVEVDSIMSQYKFCKDYSLILQKKGENIQSTLQMKQQQLQMAVNNFKQKVQQNAYTREQAEGINAGLQKQNSDLQGLNQRLSSEFQAETDKYNAALRDSIQHFLTIYNKDKKYSLILSKAGDNLLYADKAYDITRDVIAGLNKSYRPAATQKSATK